MTGVSRPSARQLLGLLAERAVFGLTPERQRQVQRLLVDCPDVDAEAMDRLAAALARSGMPSVPEPLPSSLRTLVRQTAIQFVSSF